MVANCNHQKSKLRVVAGAEGLWVEELRVQQLKIGSKSCFGKYIKVGTRHLFSYLWKKVRWNLLSNSGILFSKLVRASVRKEWWRKSFEILGWSPRICKSFEITKGQIFSKRFFYVFDFLQKTNENWRTWGIIVVKSNSFVQFLEEIKDIKNPFKIIWPLEHFIGTVKG